MVESVVSVTIRFEATTIQSACGQEGVTALQVHSSLPRIVVVASIVDCYWAGR